MRAFDVRDLALAAWALWFVARVEGWERERFEARAVIRALRRSTRGERRAHARALVRSGRALDARRRAFVRILASLLLAHDAVSENEIKRLRVA